jgi:hypothetical protein
MDDKTSPINTLPDAIIKLFFNKLPNPKSSQVLKKASNEGLLGRARGD